MRVVTLNRNPSYLSVITVILNSSISIVMPPIRVRVKDRTLKIEIDFNRTVNDLFDYLADVVDFNGDHCRLIISGKLFLPSKGIDEIGTSPRLEEITKPNSVALFLASTTAEDVERIRAFKPDPLLKGLEKEIQDHESRLKRTIELKKENPWGSGADQDPDFRFDRYEVLFRRLDPPPFEAEKLLKKLATDPGIVRIMKTRRFKVGTLCELDPLDADLEQAQKGEGDKCLLGWNRNFGQRIALRLRTDDLKSFRKYDSIINTLIHELVHNIYGNHDDAFWRLFNELYCEYRQYHSARRNANRVVGDMAPLKSPFPETTAERKSGRKAAESVRDKPTTPEELRAARLAALDKRSR